MRDNVVDMEHMRCIDCGAVVRVLDVYARNSFKRCPECQQQHRKAYNAEMARQHRQKARERREEEKTEVKLLREKNRLLEREVRNLEYLVKALSEQVEKLCNPDPVRDSRDIKEARRKKELV